MLGKACFSFLLLMCMGLIFDVRVANACSCGATPTVLESFEDAHVVVIVKVVGVERSEESRGYDNVSSTKTIVEKVYKGNLKAGDEMIFGQGGGADCVWTFEH
jgi:hypothetical protein